MMNQWMKKSLVALHVCAVMSIVHAADEQQQAASGAEKTTSQVGDASQALNKQEGDATAETNLQEVFTSNERQYSLIKKRRYFNLL